MTDIFLTSGSSWTVPSNCRKVNWVRCYGAGAYGQVGSNFSSGAANGNGGYGGGGGAFSQSGSFSVVPGSSISINVGVSSTNGGDTWLLFGGTYQAYAEGGRGQSGGVSQGYGVINYNGGSGGNAGVGYTPNTGGFTTSYGGGGGGGGGAAGPSGNGYAGAGGASGQGTDAGGAGGSGDGSYSGQGGNGGSGTTGTGNAGSSGYAYGGGGGGGAGGINAGAGGAGYAGLIWINYDPTYNWTDNALIAPQVVLGATPGMLLPIAGDIGGATSVETNCSTPQQFMLSGLSAVSGIGADAPNKFKGLYAGLPIASFASGRFSGPVNMFAGLAVNAIGGGQVNQLETSNAMFGVKSNSLLTLSQIEHISQFATLSPNTGILAKPNLPGQIDVTWLAGTTVGANVFPAQFMSAGLIAELFETDDAQVSVYVWDTTGDQLLYAAASGLEKAMIDADAPRFTGIYAEAIIDSWDPQAIDYSLLPYLAWAMGVTFWNDNWSEQTKRDWVAAQWQFKALRGTNDGIKMAVQFAGRDVSPYGYSVRQIITRPQGQYPGPGPTAASQALWLESLPQVRVYNIQEPGQALADEWYCGFSWLGTGHIPITRLLFSGMGGRASLISDFNIIEAPNTSALLTGAGSLGSIASLWKSAPILVKPLAQLIPVLPLLQQAGISVLSPQAELIPNFTQLYESDAYLWVGAAVNAGIASHFYQYDQAASFLNPEAAMIALVDLTTPVNVSLVFAIASNLNADITQIMETGATLVVQTPAPSPLIAISAAFIIETYIAGSGGRAIPIAATLTAESPAS